MEPREGQRVCSKIRGNYYRIPGICAGRSSIQLSDIPGWDYRIKLDNGQTIILNENEIDEVTAEDEENFRKQQERAEEINQRAKDRVKRMSKDREEAERLRQQKKQEAEQEKLDQQAKERQEHNEAMRKEMARVYGARSLKEVTK